MTEKMVNDWYALQKQLAILKAKEMILRKQLVSEITNNGASNTVTKELFGYELKAANKVSYSIDKPALEHLKDSLSKEEEVCIKWSPSIVVAGYNELSNSSILKGQLVTVKAAAPTLAVLSVLSVEE